jgi:hypothetical protein
MKEQDMNNIERDGERRRLRAQERLGTDNPRCCICGEDNPHCLERHHIAGQAYADETIIVCRNCHRKLSDVQKGHPENNGSPADQLERIGRFLLGLADLFELLITKLREFGAALIARSQTSPSHP